MSDFLSENSEIAARIPGFVSRESQNKMAQLVTEVIESSRHGIIEAGTGTGKTFAYLLPALASGKKIIVSTGTKNLQDQIFYSDLPVVNQEYHLKVALLKGRANYLCPQRLEKNLASYNSQAHEQLLIELVRVRDWSQHSKTGDLTDLLDAGQTSAVLPLVTSTVDNCLGHECPKFDVCPVYRARSIAHEADLVVVNHHLLFADIALKEETTTRLLPEADLIIVDEAHQVPDVARQFFGERISTGQLFELARDVQSEQVIVGNDDPELKKLAGLFDSAISDLIAVCNQTPLALDELLQQSDVQQMLEGVDVTLATMISHLARVAMRSVTMNNCYSRAMRLADLFAMLTEPETAEFEYAHWIDRTERGFIIFLSPVDVARELKPVFNQSKKSWIFVSATLTVAGSFTHIKTALGLDDVVEGQFDSPFNYQEQTCGFIPANLPTPGSDIHTRKLLETVLPIIRVNSGRTFYLFTSHRALRLTADLLQREYDIVFLMQGALPKKLLLEKFRELPRCVLLATQSFWEGVDVRGADLRCLIIDKLPFASPDNPMVQAQMRAIEQKGGNGFRQYSLPEAAISLKQGFGRLIRQESDQGLFILGDPRVNTRSYGKILLNSLPTMNWLNNEAEAETYMSQIERRRQ